jgi:hypothetical protein
MGQTPSRLEYAPAMIWLVAMPSSIATRVYLGRHPIASRSSLAVARRRVRIGFLRLREAAAPL